MNTIRVLISLLLAATALPLAGAEAETVTATLQVGAGNHLAPALLAECDVTVLAGATVGGLLDAAVEQGCIESWAHSSFPGFGRYVTCVDDLCEENVGGLVGTFWAFYVDDVFANAGIDATPVVTGSAYEFVYSDWYVSSVLP